MDQKELRERIGFIQKIKVGLPYQLDVVLKLIQRIELKLKAHPAVVLAKKNDKIPNLRLY